MKKVLLGLLMVSTLISSSIFANYKNLSSNFLSNSLGIFNIHYEHEIINDISVLTKAYYQFKSKTLDISDIETSYFSVSILGQKYFNENFKGLYVSGGLSYTSFNIYDNFYTSKTYEKNKSFISPLADIGYKFIITPKLNITAYIGASSKPYKYTATYTIFSSAEPLQSNIETSIIPHIGFSVGYSF